MFIFNIFTTYIQHIYPSPFAGASLHLLIACKLSGKNLPGAEPRIELRPVSQQSRACLAATQACLAATRACLAATRACLAATRVCLTASKIVVFCP